MPEVSDILSVASPVLGVVKGIADFFGEKSKEEKAREELSRLKQPFYKIQDEYTQNRNIAASQAAGGLGDETKNFYTTEAQRGLGSTLNAVNMAGGSPNDAGKLLDIYTRNINRVASEDANARVQNMQRFFDANRELAGQKTIKWSLDEYRPWERKLKEITQRIGAAETNQNNALNNAIGAVGATGTALSNSQLMNDLFSNNQPTYEDNRVYGDVAPVSSADVRSASPVIPTSLGNNIPTQNAVFNPYSNPYGAGNGYWNGRQWVPAETTKMGY